MPPGIARILDARLVYRASDIAPLLSSLGEHGRRAYVLHELTDLVFIGLYTVLLQALASGGRVVSRIVFAPGAFDAVETLGIIALLLLYPTTNGTLATVVSIATPAKWLAVAGAAAALAIRYGRRAIMRKR
jgi:hypothetical protein